MSMLINDTYMWSGGNARVRSAWNRKLYIDENIYLFFSYLCMCCAQRKCQRFCDQHLRMDEDNEKAGYHFVWILNTYLLIYYDYDVMHHTVNRQCFN